MNLQRIEFELKLNNLIADFILFSFLMFNSMKDMYKASNWSGKGFASRQNLMEKLQSKNNEGIFLL
jgi:hypothetical protein